MNILNYTKHNIIIPSTQGKDLLYASLGTITYNSLLNTKFPFNTIPFEVINNPSFTGIYPLPEYNDNDVLVVSSVVGEYFRKNPDKWKGRVIVPDLEPTSVVFDEETNTITIKQMFLYKGVNE